MSLEKDNIKYRYGVDENNVIEVSRIVRILEDGKEITRYQEGFSIKPGADCSKEDSRTINIAQKIHTQAVIAEYEAKTKEPMEVKPVATK